MKVLAALPVLCLFIASSVRATVVYWDLDPKGTAGTANSASHSVPWSSSAITGNGYAADWQSNIPLGQYHEFGRAASGTVRLADSPRHENQYFSIQSVQLDVNSILLQGFADEKLQQGSVRSTSDDAFALLRSSTFRDSRGQAEGINGGPSDMVFASIANLTNDKVTSGRFVSGTMMTVPFQATLTPVPEISALFPIIGLIAAVAVTQFLRRRRIAQVRASSLDPN